jgi:hypothetical protein
MKRSFSLQELHSAISEQESSSRAAMTSHADVLSLGYAGATLSTMRRSKSMNALENHAEPGSPSCAGDLILPSLASLVRSIVVPCFAWAAFVCHNVFSVCSGKSCCCGYAMHPSLRGSKIIMINMLNVSHTSPKSINFVAAGAYHFGYVLDT